MQPCDSSPAQVWRLSAVGEIESNLTSDSNHSMCLDGGDGAVAVYTNYCVRNTKFSAGGWAQLWHWNTAGTAGAIVLPMAVGHTCAVSSAEGGLILAVCTAASEWAWTLPASAPLPPLPLGGCNSSGSVLPGEQVEFQPSHPGSTVRSSTDGRRATAVPSLTLQATVVSEQTYVSGTHTFRLFGTVARGNKVVGVSLGSKGSPQFLGFGAESWGFSSWSGNKIHNDSVGSGQPFSESWGAGVEVGIVLDADAGTLSFAVGGRPPQLAWSGLPTGAALRHAGGYRLAASMCCGQGIVLGGAPHTGTRIVVNAANTTGRATQKCSGFLCTSIWANEPQDQLLRPIKPRFINGQANWVRTSEFPSLLADGVFERQVVDLNMTVLLRLESSYAPHFLNSDAWHWFDLHECNATSPAGALGCRWPCDRSDCGRWEGWLRELVSRIEARAARWSVDADANVWYDPWNEVQFDAFNASGVAAGGFWPRSMDQYRDLWSSAQRTIKQLRPAAVVAGPSIGDYDFGWLTSFLLWSEANGTVPDALTWHEFGVDGNAIPSHVEEITTWLEAQSSPELRRLTDRLLVPENIYGPNTPAVTLSYMAAHERTTTLFMGHACWDDGGLDNVKPYSYVGGYVGCNEPLLNHLLTQDIVPQPRARWWVYERYASITGELLDIRVNNPQVPAMAGVDAGVVRVLVGNTDILAQNATALEVVGVASWGEFVTVSASYIPDTDATAVPTLATAVLYPRLATTHCANNAGRCVVVQLQCLASASVLFVEFAPAADETVGSPVSSEIGPPVQ
jgi:hypothetical protein